MKIKFRPDIEGLRAIAILLVVLYHARVPGFSGGFIGVDVFYVLSGYLITSLLVTEQSRTGRISLLEFYARRSRRLLPAVSFLILFVVVACYFIFAPIEQIALARTAVYTSAYLSNVFFARNAVDYLAEGAEFNPLLHTWSLAVEEQFYLVFPVSLVIAFVLIKRIRIRESTGVFTGFVIVFLVSAVSSIYFTEVRQPWAFFLTPFRAWEFALGGVGFLIVHYFPKFSADSNSGDSESSSSRFNKGAIWGWLCLAGLLIGSAVYGKQTEFPGYAAFLPAVATVGILVNQKSEEYSANRFLGHSLLQYIGKLSYSWYLWHWTLLVLFDSLFEETLHFTSKIAIVGIAFLASLLSFKLIENPIRFSTYLKPRPAISVSLAVALTLFCVTVSYLWWYQAKTTSEGPDQSRFTEAASDVPELYSAGCHANFRETRARGCEFGNPQGDKTVVLYGDSHAAQWFPGLQQAANARGWKLLVFTKSACGAVEALHFVSNVGRKYTECGEWRKSVIAKLKELKPDMIFATSATSYDYTPEEWRDGIKGAVSSLSSAEGKVVWIADTPSLEYNGPYCLARDEWRKGFIPKFRSCTFDLEKAINQPVATIFENEIEGNSSVSYLDLNDEICDRSPCRLERNGNIIFRDSHHLTVSFSRSLSREFDELLAE